MRRCLLVLLALLLPWLAAGTVFASPSAHTTVAVEVVPGGGFGPYSNRTLLVTITADVNSVDMAGTATFTDSIDGVLGSAPVPASFGVAYASFSTNALGPGDHVVTVLYTPNDPNAAAAGVGYSPFISLRYDPVPDAQILKVGLDPGSLTISTRA